MFKTSDTYSLGDCGYFQSNNMQESIHSEVAVATSLSDHNSLHCIMVLQWSADKIQIVTVVLLKRR